MRGFARGQPSGQGTEATGTVAGPAGVGEVEGGRVRADVGRGAGSDGRGVQKVNKMMIKKRERGRGSKQ